MHQPAEAVDYLMTTTDVLLEHKHLRKPEIGRVEIVLLWSVMLYY